ncbi:MULTISPECIES: NVEALA domain-containing protein [Bacteroidales]|jgi:hypothetical protein|uniref:NVEALA domain-containing protein n=1 Tax=Bacteroidales TaxID=171549 RepID=UPI00256FFD03|nr:NVEALA domain-containing protein [Bacteroides acidifaciens]
MKKAVFATIVAIAGLSGIYAYQTQSTIPQKSLLTVANVEALTSNETTVKECDPGKDVCDAVLVGSTLYVFTYN